MVVAVYGQVVCGLVVVEVAVCGLVLAAGL